MKRKILHLANVTAFYNGIVSFGFIFVWGWKMLGGSPCKAEPSFASLCYALIAFSLFAGIYIVLPDNRKSIHIP